MHNSDRDRVTFYSKSDMMSGFHLSIAESVLRSDTKSAYEDINDVLELYNIRKYLDNELYLKSWNEDDISNFKQKATEYAKVVGQFMSEINDSNFISYYEQLPFDYTNSFWELVNSQKTYERIPTDSLATILSNEPHVIRTILTYKNLVSHYDVTLKDFLITYPKSAELLLAIYEEKKDSHDKEMFLPDSLTLQDKENIIFNYLDSDDANPNYVELIANLKNQGKIFAISDKTRLKAKRKEAEMTAKMFTENRNNVLKYGVQISFAEDVDKIIQIEFENLRPKYTYSTDHIKQNADNYSLFQNFINLFFYLDTQRRIGLVSKINQMGTMERLFGVRSKNEYIHGIAFGLSETTSHLQIVAYSKIVNDLELVLENILQTALTSIFQEKYNFADNAHITMPSANTSYLEKVRMLAPEFESILKQYKFFVEDGKIDLDLLKMSSSSHKMREIPSLVPSKYVYLNENNKEVVNCSHLFFSDQTMLTYVEPYKEKRYSNFLELILNEQVNFNNYEEYQKPEINYLVDKGLVAVDKSGFIEITNLARVRILKDLYDNEVMSFYRCPLAIREEAKQMETQNMVFFESSLFSKPEQSYFNYYLNDQEFTNGWRLRNRYLHGTQANPDEINHHETAYFKYLKLLVLVLLKIEDDLAISQAMEKVKKQ